MSPELSARAVRLRRPRRDYACRYGGEESALLLPDTDEQAAVAWAERCRSAIAETPLAVEGVSVQITASFKVTPRHDEVDPPEKLLDLADQSLLEAKRSGRNRVVAFGSLQHQTLG